MTTPQGTVVRPTHYTYKLSPDDYSSTTAPPKPPGRTQRAATNISIRLGPTRNTGGLFGSPRIVAVAWLFAMGVIAVDEWHNNHILPRPSRLWWATLLFALLAGIGTIPAINPLANVLAIGYAIMLLWQYYNKEGQFSG